jgi:UPF0176 protein
MSDSIHITASYAFLPISEEQLPILQKELKQFGDDRNMKGLMLLATEGINSTVSGSLEAIADWKNRLRELKSDIVFKDSTSEDRVFRRWSVKIKKEIVALQKDDVHPNGHHRHITPQEWNEMMQKEDVVIIDARNDYEVAIGKFEGAIDPKIKTFSEFPEFVKESQIPKEKKVLMYCTGGIRCEKALLEMEKQGYSDVYQLEGGILNYLQQCPDEKFEGECFVFDKRVAVDQSLKPSQTYFLCPHCGDPGTKHIECIACSKESVICHDCAIEQHHHTCSKNCAYIASRKTSIAGGFI